MPINSVNIIPQGRAILETFLSREISSEVTGIYIPPFYMLPGVAAPKVGTFIPCNRCCGNVL